MPGPRVIHVRAPLGGVYKRSSFQERPEFTAYDALNFIPTDFKTGQSRERLAIRPGFTSFPSPTTDPVGEPINLQVLLHIAPGEALLRQPMIAADDVLYRWDATALSWVVVGGSNVDTGRPVCAIAYLQKVYILNETLAYKVYTFSGHSVGSWTGSPPADCRFGCVWDDRIVLSGNLANPHVVNFSRQLDPTDWVDAEDSGAPIVSTSIEGGNISEPVTAVIPHGRECLIVGGWNTLNVYRGNPRRGGRLALIPSVVGPICWTAWCYTADGWLYFLTRDGLYRMPPGCGTSPTSVSRERIPEELLALDGINDIAYLEYDVRFRGIYIVVTGSHASKYWFDLEKQGFWPITTLAADIQSLFRFDQFETEDASGVMFGGSNGLTRLDRTVGLEAGAEAFLQVGPIRLDKSLDNGAHIYEAVARFGSNTDDTTGTLELFTALDAESVVEMPQEGSWSEGIFNLQQNNGRCSPDLSGQAAFINIEQGDEGSHISFEQLDLHTRPHGKDR